MTAQAKTGTVAIQYLLGSNRGLLADIRRRTAELQVIYQKLKAILPPPLCDHFILANIDKNTVTLHADSSAWAARLRFKTPEILACIQEHWQFAPPKSIRTRVVHRTTQTTPTKRSVHLSAKNARLIRDTANSISDPVLRDALLRLSRNN